MKLVRGFFLLETLLYCALLALLSVLVFHFFTHTSAYVRRYRSLNTQTSIMLAAGDLMTHDIMQASAQTGHWKKKPQAMSWQTMQGIVRWKCKNNTLYRTLYTDVFPKQKKATSIVAQNIKHIVWNMHCEKGRVARVSCEITPERGESKEISAALRNRVII